MARSAEEKKRRAIKYGRRHRLLQASGSAADLDRAVAGLLKDLAKSRIPKATQQELVAQLRASRDHTRRRRAIWAIVDALESTETG